MPGDEIGSIDWKIFGRSDKLFIKIFEHQADLTVNLLIDASASMAYRGVADSRRRRLPPWPADDRPSKYDYACSLAAAIGFLIVKQHDCVGFSLAQGGLTQFLAARSTLAHLSAILDAMEQATAPGQGAAGRRRSRSRRANRAARGADRLQRPPRGISDAILRTLSLFRPSGRRSDPVPRPARRRASSAPNRKRNLYRQRNTAPRAAERGRCADRLRIKKFRNISTVGSARRKPTASIIRSVPPRTRMSASSSAV